MTIKHMLSGTAIAVLLTASPALAQAPADSQAPAPQQETQAVPGDTAPSMPPADATPPAGESPAGDVTQTPSTDMPDVAETPSEPAETYFTMQGDNELLASELIGTNVENLEEETLGSVSDVLISDEDGIKAVVIGVGGFLGIGTKNVAVNFGEIEQMRDGDGNLELRFAATREDLDSAPEFQTLEQQMAEAARSEREAQQQMQTPAAPPAGGVQ